MKKTFTLTSIKKLPGREEYRVRAKNESEIVAFDVTTTKKEALMFAKSVKAVVEIDCPDPIYRSMKN